MSDRQKEDEQAADADFIEINPYGDMACTIVFIVQITATLWHAKVSVTNTQEEKVIRNNVLVLASTFKSAKLFLCNRNARKTKARKPFCTNLCWAQLRSCLEFSCVKKLERKLPNGSRKSSSQLTRWTTSRCFWQSLVINSGSWSCMWCVNWTQSLRWISSSSPKT